MADVEELRAILCEIDDADILGRFIHNGRVQQSFSRAFLSLAEIYLKFRAKPGEVMDYNSTFSDPPKKQAVVRMRVSKDKFPTIHAELSAQKRIYLGTLFSTNLIRRVHADFTECPELYSTLSQDTTPKPAEVPPSEVNQQQQPLTDEPKQSEAAELDIPQIEVEEIDGYEAKSLIKDESYRQMGANILDAFDDF